MAKGEFPITLKLAQITSIPKISNPKSADDYRPISILSTFSKVFEKLIYSRLYSFVTSTCILSPAPDLDGGGSGAQAWWEAPCADRNL